MQLIRGFYNISSFTKGCALTIGNFDGVHLGHQAILHHLNQQAKKLGLPTVVMLFEPQVKEFFLQQKAPARLMRLRDKLRYLREQKVDYVLCIQFNQTFANLSANSFIQDFLVKKLNVKFLSIGDDFRFGINREGDFDTLKKAGEQFGFNVENNTTFSFGKQRISSTAIRQALSRNDFRSAKLMLGREYNISGRVVKGRQLGRTIGFPTANIMLKREVIPLQGVYAVKIKDQKGRYYTGVANVGNRPTVNGSKSLLEVHIFDVNKELYGQRLDVIFCFKIRDEQKFASIEALSTQIAQDASVARTFFESEDKINVYGE
ncbi:riboflavin biosynthesis protein RibF [Mergibacter septicus]|uniref:bifunctional riboflavin kinase/FAD synthetase n=1 Tax=Mergibacter septicus TaxID=221402 RepID=UPI001C76E0F4|nr:bifunctional riboflavin kinase/FAD synthetase [Mergibacter septicus]QDJ12440.1 riboflavin biosynthesis protein RibF [Mergibacter septicus]